jgi:cytochrome b6-f complex iron-sulfur subunit
MLTRREICSQLLQWLVAGGFFHLTWKYTQGTSPSSLEVSFDERPLEGNVIFNHSVYLVGLKQGIKALSARCPHLGCRLEYNATERRFQCPCHGSLFSLEGQRLGGPTKKDMTVLNLRSYNKCGAYKVTLPLF